MKKNTKKLLKRLKESIIKISLITSLTVAGCSTIKFHIQASDGYVRDRVVKLTNENKGSCSGIKVKADSGKVVILTAAHCIVILDKNKKMIAIDEDGKKETVSFIAEDPFSDLMLLSTEDTRYIDISADDTEVHQKVHTLTHGAGHETYRTDGELMEIELTQIGLFEIQTKDDMIRCVSMPKNVPYPTIFGPVCVLETEQRWSSALVVPGSSGGALLDEAGHLVGITSAGDAHFGLFVLLTDIKAFLADY